MIGKYKKFDKELFNQNDLKSRSVVKHFFLSKNVVVDDNPNKYGVDLVSEDGNVQIEIERRLAWVNEEFPYPRVNIPERKAKFFKTDKTSYVIVSNDFSRIGVIPGKKLIKFINKKHLEESKNRFVGSGELFYKIPKEEFKWFKIDN